MYRIDYLLKYVSNEMFKKINKKSDYILEKLEKNYVDVDLNIRYLIKYGVINIDNIVYNMLDDLCLLHNDFIMMINEYEKRLDHDEVIMLLDNL